MGASNLTQLWKQTTYFIDCGLLKKTMFRQAAPQFPTFMQNGIGGFVSYSYQNIPVTQGYKYHLVMHNKQGLHMEANSLIYW